MAVLTAYRRQVIRRTILWLVAATTVLTTGPAYASTPFMVLFETDSVAIDGYGEVVLDNAAATVRQHDVRLLTVAGHADRVGPLEYNLRLSRDRAEAVRAALVARGVPAAIIRIEAWGESRPIVDTVDDVAESQNRSAFALMTRMCDPPPGWSRWEGC